MALTFVYFLPSFSSSSSLCRHLRASDAAELGRSGDLAVQDVGASRPAEPRLQGDLCLPGGAVPAVGRHAAGLHLQPAQHEAQRDDRLDRSGPEQQRRGGAAPLAGHEGESRTTGLPLARPAGGVTLPAGQDLVFSF